MAQRVAPFWSFEKVCADLDLNPDELTDAVERRVVLGLQTADRMLVFPVAQFERTEARVQVREGIRAMLPEFPRADGWTVAQVLTTKAPELASRSPYTAEREGVAPVALAEYARTLNLEMAP